MGTTDNHGTPLPGLLPGCAVDADAEWAQYVAWLDREAAAGREPEPWDPVDDEPWDGSWPGDQGPADPDFRDPVPAGPVPAGHAPGGSVPAGRGRPLFAEDGAADVIPRPRSWRR
jgi:hypothetical protein